VQKCLLENAQLPESEDSDYELIEIKEALSLEDQPGLLISMESGIVEEIVHDLIQIRRHEVGESLGEKEESPKKQEIKHESEAILYEERRGAFGFPLLAEGEYPCIRFEHSVFIEIKAKERKKRKVFRPSEPKDLANFLQGAFLLMEPGHEFQAELHIDDKLLMGYILNELQRDSSLDVEFLITIGDRSVELGAIGFLKGAAEGGGVATIASVGVMSVTHGVSCLAVGALAPISLTLAGITVPVVVICLVAGGLIYGIIKGFREYQEGKKRFIVKIELKEKKQLK